MVLAGRPPARLAPGISLGAAVALGRPQWRRRANRAAPDAAARSFFADPVRQGGRWRRDHGAGGEQARAQLIDIWRGGERLRVDYLDQCLGPSMITTSVGSGSCGVNMGG